MCGRFVLPRRLDTLRNFNTALERQVFKPDHPESQNALVANALRPGTMHFALVNPESAMCSLVRPTSMLVLILAMSLPMSALGQSASCSDDDPRVEGFRSDITALKDDIFAKEARLKGISPGDASKGTEAACEVTSARIAFFVKMRDFARVCPSLPHLRENVSKSRDLLSKLQHAKAAHCR